MGDLEDLAAVAEARRGRVPRPVRRAVGVEVWVPAAVVSVALLAGALYFFTRPAVSLIEYRQVEQGMTYGEVREIVGTAGEVVESGGAQVGLLRVDAVAYVWRNRTGGEMRVAFVNGKVVAKSQRGLR